ncbi:MAG TPA: CDP-alcohol phosphatidyltransferase family protein, partial [Candidatus Limnocylindrales bacterium]
MSESQEPTSRVWTIPNIISMLRIVLIVAFAVLLARRADGWAIIALVAAGVSDFFDGFLARRWNQVTTLGRVLDPAADRLLTLAVVIGLGLRGIVPWWLVAVLLARDAVVGIALLIGRRRGVGTPQVTLVGKAATFGLYWFLPLSYLAYGHSDAWHAIGIWGSAASAAAYW